MVFFSRSGGCSSSEGQPGSSSSSSHPQASSVDSGAASSWILEQFGRDSDKLITGVELKELLERSFAREHWRECIGSLAQVKKLNVLRFLRQETSRTCVVTSLSDALAEHQKKFQGEKKVGGDASSIVRELEALLEENGMKYSSVSKMINVFKQIKSDSNNDKKESCSASNVLLLDRWLACMYSSRNQQDDDSVVRQPAEWEELVREAVAFTQDKVGSIAEGNRNDDDLGKEFKIKRPRCHAHNHRHVAIRRGNTQLFFRATKKTPPSSLVAVTQNNEPGHWGEIEVEDPLDDLRFRKKLKSEEAVQEQNDSEEGTSYKSYPDHHHDTEDEVASQEGEWFF